MAVAFSYVPAAWRLTLGPWGYNDQQDQSVRHAAEKGKTEIKDSSSRDREDRDHR